MHTAGYVRCPDCGGEDIDETTVTVDRRYAYGRHCRQCDALWEE